MQGFLASKNLTSKTSARGIATATALSFVAAISLSACNVLSTSNTPQALPTVVLGEKNSNTTVAQATQSDQSSQSSQSSIVTGGQVKASGVVVPAQQLQMVATSAGQIQSVNVKVGDVVQAGQLLVALEDSATQAALAQANASLATAQANYDLLAAGPTEAQIKQAEAALLVASASYSRTLNGSRPADIAAAQAALNAANESYQKVQAGPVSEDIAAAQATLRSAEAALKQAQNAYDNAFRQNPAAIGASPAALALEQATNTYEAAKAVYDRAVKPSDNAQLAAAAQQVESARAALDRARRPATAYDIAQAKAQVVAAQAELDAVKAGPRAEQLAAAKAQVQAAQTQVQSIETQLQKMQLPAPMAGTVSKIELHGGEWAIPGQPILVLADLQHLRIETTDLSERDVPLVKLGQPVNVFVKALNQNITGKLIEIAPLADSIGVDVVYKTTIELDSQPDGLRAGMSVEVGY